VRKWDISGLLLYITYFRKKGFGECHSQGATKAFAHTGDDYKMIAQRH
jgi:hypothetical protein